MILCANPHAQYLSHRDEICVAIQKVLDSGSYILGEEVKAFEREFAQYLGVSFAIGCGSGTDALVLALKALDIGHGDEVIVPSYTAVPTIAAVVMAGATPVFVDIESDYYSIDYSLVEAACNVRTKAIISVHLYGQAAAIEGLMCVAKSRGLHVIEDCAQASGASWQEQKLGTIADIGCFSFFPTKNLGAIGDGGAVVCNDESLAERLRCLRQYGWDEQRISREHGMNSRLDELQAAILRIKLRYLDSDNDQRRSLATRYSDALRAYPLSLPAERDDAFHVYHLYVVQTKERSTLIEYLKRADIYAGIHYPVPVHKMEAYFRDDIILPVTDYVANSVLSLPLYPGMGEDIQTRVISAVSEYFDK